MARKVRTPASDLGVLVSLCVAVLFIVSAVMFIFTQFDYRASVLGIEVASKSFAGFYLTFGDSNFEGKMYFGLVFIFAVLGAASAILALLNYLKVIKINPLLFFGICGVTAIVSIIVYFVLFFDVNSALKIGGIQIEVKDNIFFTIWFWIGVVANALALVVSGFGTVMARR